jgi:hypothetical protein
VDHAGEDEVGDECRRCRSARRSGRWAEEHHGLNREHRETEDDERPSSLEPGAEEEPHPAEQGADLEAQRNERRIPQTQTDFGAVVPQRQVGPVNEKVQRPVREDRDAHEEGCLRRAPPPLRVGRAGSD